VTFDLDQGLAVLARTPAALAALLAGLGPEWTAAGEGGESFSPFDVVGHLIDGEETDWLPRARLILAGGDRPFPPFDRFRHRDRNRGRRLDALLDELARLRAENLRALRSMALAPADLARTGRHPALGTVTLAELLATWVAHDLDHLAQVARVMAGQYAAAVGPWRAYLPILGQAGPQPGR
jgi:hypothetical protein